MKIGIIGPNKSYENDLKARLNFIDVAAKFVADSGHEIVLTPDKDSLLECFGKKYIGFKGKKIWLVIPTDEPDYSSYLNVELGTVIDCIDWDRQANEFNRSCDVFVCIGYSWGALKEIACAQYFSKKKIYIINEFVSGKLPGELSFLVNYIDLKDLEGIL